MKKDRIFFVINEASEALSLSNRPRHVLNLVLNVLAKFLGADASWVHLTGVSGADEVLTVSRGLTAVQSRELQAPGLRHLLENRMGTGDLIVIPDLSRDDSPGMVAFVKAGFSSMVVVPLVTGQSKGILGTVWRATKDFDTDYGLLLMVVGNLVCSALNRAALYERLLGGAELEPDVKYDIEEFEKLVTLAEQYSRATRQAISEAVVRAKGTESPVPPSLETSGDVDLTLQQGLEGPQTGHEKSEGLPSSRGGEDTPKACPMDPHERRMRDFARRHAPSYKVLG